MSEFYENTLLRQEFNLCKKLQQHPIVKKYIQISYEDEIDGNILSILSSKIPFQYPEIYHVTYNLPVYINVGQLTNDWQGKAIMRLSEEALVNRTTSPNVDFKSNFCPFNNHVKEDWVCTGNAWQVAKNFGFWNFVICIGALINQDEFVTDTNSRIHLNDLAFDYWINRSKRPVTPIQWPMCADDLEKVKIVRVEKNKGESKKVIKIFKKNRNQNIPYTPAKKMKFIKKS